MSSVANALQFSEYMTALDHILQYGTNTSGSSAEELIYMKKSIAHTLLLKRGRNSGSLLKNMRQLVDVRISNSSKSSYPHREMIGTYVVSI